jgi:hypothetical protein
VRALAPASVNLHASETQVVEAQKAAEAIYLSLRDAKRRNLRIDDLFPRSWLTHKLSERPQTTADYIDLVIAQVAARQSDFAEKDISTALSPSLIGTHERLQTFATIIAAREKRNQNSATEYGRRLQEKLDACAQIEQIGDPATLERLVGDLQSALNSSP